ncbi:MAG: hypothetical protein L0Y79_02150 [Chlorobi bacterium]|nr:hypothetical protein [Chlorobiota bacterium]MCI0716575.1 hypothetical protein [Chlorobiota bacterium]
MKVKPEFVYVKETIPIEVEEGSILNISTKEVTSFTHGFHKYPAKFIPHLPKWAISKYLNGFENKTILEPFCGSGTTLVEGILAGHNVIGFDVDPLSVLISKVKITRIDVPTLDIICDWLIKNIKRKRNGNFKPACENLKHWFTEDAIRKLSLIRGLIDQIQVRFGSEKEIKDIVDLLIICFSSIIRRVSNADNESQKTYVSHTKLKMPEEVNNLFFQQLVLFFDRIRLFTDIVNPNLHSKVVCTSSNVFLLDKLEGHNIDLVITSPPYIKSIDYIYNQMAELFWVGDLFDMQTQDKQNGKKREYIGNKHLSKVEFKHYTPINTPFGIESLDKKLQIVFNSDKKNGHKHSYITYKYFLEMEKHFKEMSKCLTVGTPYIVIIGDSKVSGTYFDTANIVIEIARRNGFKLINKWGYKIKNRYMRFDRKGRGGIIEIDWVLELEKQIEMSLID